MQNPWFSHGSAEEGSGEWEVTSPMERQSYLDKVRGAGKEVGRDVGREVGKDVGGGAVHSTGARSASSATTPIEVMDAIFGSEVSDGNRWRVDGDCDTYVLEKMVVDTTGEPRNAPRAARWSGQAGVKARAPADAVISSSKSSQFLPVPSGKREQGEGCEDESQGILAAHFSPSTRTAVLQITYLAAGFLIGEKGQSVRDMERITSTSIKSWKDKTAGGRPVRKLVIQSEDDGIGPEVGIENLARCLHIIKAAVMHYKDLCEGLYCGEYVEPVRVIEGVAFTYNPPPRKSVPFAAGIKVKASKVMDAYGGEVEGVPSKYKKEVDRQTWKDEGGVMDILERVRDMEREASVDSQESNHGNNGIKVERRKGRRGGRKLGHAGNGGLRQQPLNEHPEFGLFEVPCDEDYQPKERDSSRRRQRQRMDGDVDSAAPVSSTAHAWTSTVWGSHRFHPLHQQEQEIRGAAVAHTRMHVTPSNHLKPCGSTTFFDPWSSSYAPSMPWTGVDTLSGVSQQSLEGRCGQDEHDSHSWARTEPYTELDGDRVLGGLGDCGGFDGFGGSDGFGGFDARRLIPSAWEDLGTHGMLMGSGMSSRMLSKSQEDARPGRSRVSRNVFSSYEFCEDTSFDQERPRRMTRRDQSWENMFAEFSEKCRVGEPAQSDSNSRWMKTPSRDISRGEHVDKENEPAAVERSRRRLHF